MRALRPLSAIPSPLSVIPAQAGIHLSYRRCDKATALRAGKSRNLRVTPQFGALAWDVAFLDSRLRGNDGGERAGMTEKRDGNGGRRRWGGRERGSGPAVTDPALADGWGRGRFDIATGVCYFEAGSSSSTD